MHILIIGGGNYSYICVLLITFVLKKLYDFKVCEPEYMNPPLIIDLHTALFLYDVNSVQRQFCCKG